MADAGVAMNAIEHVASLFGGQQVVDELFVAMETSLLGHTTIPGLNLDGVLEVTGGEGDGMEGSVVGFGDPFANRMMRQMAIVARRDTVMA